MSNARELAELSGSYGTGGFVGMKNRIINGQMMIDQRNAGASVASGYAVDRFNSDNATDGVYTLEQVEDAPAGFNYSVKLTVTTADASLAAGQYSSFFQVIEGYNIADLNWGTSNAQSVTLSFWVKSNLTGTFGGSLRGASSTRSYPFTYTVLASNTWEQKSVTVVGCHDGTWLTTNGAGVQVFLNIGTGATFSGTAGAWASASYRSATGATNVLATIGNTIQWTGVQLEKGSTATSFDYRPYGTELALCQRYYYRLKAGSSYGNAGVGRAYATTNGQAVVAMPVSMRAAPTGGYSALTDWNAAGSGSITAMSPAAQYSLDYRQMTIDITNTFSSGQSVILNANNTTNAWIDWSAEL